MGHQDERLQDKGLRLSLKSRLLLIIASVLLLAAGVSGILTMHNARESIRAEIASTSELVRGLIKDELGVLPDIAHQDVIRDIYSILEGVRHIHVMLAVNGGRHDSEQVVSIPQVPSWFTSMIYPSEFATELFVIKGTKSQGNLVIYPDPTDEIKELWREVMPFGLMIGISFFVLLGLTYVAIGVSLNPLDGLLAGFERVEKGEYDVVVPEDVVTELSVINRKFNHLTNVLKKTMDANRLLNRKLVDLQEDERKHLAYELHDEMSPYLFQIQVDTMAITEKVESGNPAELGKNLDSINNTTAQLQDRVRKTLKQLRPIVLDDLQMKEALTDLVRIWQAKHPDLTCKFNIDDLERCDDDTLRVSVYRIVQECLTNIIKHAGARNAWVNIKELQDEKIPGIRITIEDDGKGMGKDEKMGLGLTGMRERAEALGGWLTLQPRSGGGLRVISYLPYLPGPP